MTDSPAALIQELEKAYVWWPPSGERHPVRLVLRVAMERADWHDTSRMLRSIARQDLIDAFDHGPSGYLSPRAAAFWSLVLDRPTPPLGRPGLPAFDWRKAC